MVVWCLILYGYFIYLLLSFMIIILEVSKGFINWCNVLDIYGGRSSLGFMFFGVKIK